MDNLFIVLVGAFLLLWVCMMVLIKCFDMDNMVLASFCVLCTMIGMLAAIALALSVIVM